MTAPKNKKALTGYRAETYAVGERCHLLIVARPGFTVHEAYISKIDWEHETPHYMVRIPKDDETYFAYSICVFEKRSFSAAGEVAEDGSDYVTYLIKTDTDPVVRREQLRRVKRHADQSLSDLGKLLVQDYPDMKEVRIKTDQVNTAMRVFEAQQKVFHDEVQT